jgi:hypothetical protein
VRALAAIAYALMGMMTVSLGIAWALAGVWEGLAAWGTIGVGMIAFSIAIAILR